MAITCIEEAVQAALIADAGVTGLVKASAIKVATAGQELPTPYIVHFPVTGSPTHLLAELASIKEWSSYQVSVFADTYSSASLVSRAVVNALGRLTTAEGVQFMLSGEPRFAAFEPGLIGAASSTAIGNYHMVIEFRIFEAL